jgi:hypothetical protein
MGTSGQKLAEHGRIFYQHLAISTILIIPDFGGPNDGGVAEGLNGG